MPVTTTSAWAAPRAGPADRAPAAGIPAGWGIHQPAARRHRQADPGVAPGQHVSGRMTRQARSSAVIMGLDTHMILETVTVLPPNARTSIRSSNGHHTTTPGPWGAERFLAGLAPTADRWTWPTGMRRRVYQRPVCRL